MRYPSHCTRFFSFSRPCFCVVQIFFAGTVLNCREFFTRTSCRSSWPPGTASGRRDPDHGALSVPASWRRAGRVASNGILSWRNNITTIGANSSFKMHALSSQGALYLVGFAWLLTTPADSPTTMLLASRRGMQVTAG